MESAVKRYLPPYTLLVLLLWLNISQWQTKITWLQKIQILNDEFIK